MDSVCNEIVAASLVREFLARKKLTTTAAVFDRELPWTKECISSSSTLVDLLHLKKLVKKYKPTSSSSLLEIIIKELLSQSHVNAEHTKLDAKSSHSLAKPPLRIKRDQAVIAQTEERTVTDSSESASLYKSDETVLRCDESDTHLTSSSQTSSPESCISLSGRSPKKRQGLDALPLKSAGYNWSLPKAVEMERRTAFSSVWKNLEYSQERANDKSKRTSSAVKTVNPFGGHPFKTRVEGHEDQDLASLLPKAEFLPRVSLSHKYKADDVEVHSLSDSDFEDDFSDVVSLRQPSSSLPIPGRYLNLNEAGALKKLLFGSFLKGFNHEWLAQNFEFSTCPDTPYGIVQHKGGPCGVLAAVQAQLLLELLFKSPHPLEHIQDNRLRPSKRQCQEALSRALATILWRAGGKKHCVVAVQGISCDVDSTLKYQPDGFTEKLYQASFSTFDSVVDFFWTRRNEFESTNGRSCALLVCSAILSRGIDRILLDMDDAETTLIGKHGYCTQELVNLLLIGQAVSNVFDNEVKLESDTGDDLVLQGIPGRADIGMLSLFEHYNSCQVGIFLKKPLYPVWVILSESHFSVLFGTSLEVLEHGDLGIPFDLFYYDGLAGQCEEIRLTVDPNCGVTCIPDENDLVPPLEHCIRTRWKGASVNWNGTEPLL